MTTGTHAYAGLAPVQPAGAVFNHLLLPVDFSESNIAAARYARHIAGWGGANVTLLHVRSEGVENGHAPVEGTHVLDRVKRVLAGASVQTVVTAGDPANAISRYAAENGVDFIVMPTRGVGAVRRLVLGSVTAKVLQNAACPVLTLAADDSTLEDAEPQFHHIACAVDLGADSLRIMRSAEAIAKRSAAPLTVLHVSPQLEPVVGVVHDHEWCSYLANVLRAEIGKLKREAGIEAAVRLAAGEPARTVAEMTSELKADLLVIGRPRPRGLLGRLRTHSYAIMSEAPCPVLSV
jgi:nucleotide-binding universal stress UspA family protein